MPIEAADGGASVSPDEAFGLLGNDTRVAILQALWDAFESGSGDNALPYSELFARVDYDDSGNFSYHLEKLTGPFVRRTADGYELKQTGINILRAIVAGTVTDDPAFGPTPISIPCPVCDAPIEIVYADELIAAFCTECEGTMRWYGKPGLVVGGIVPPAGIVERSTEAGFRAAVSHIFHQAGALLDDVCPHCASTVETTVNVCTDHDPAPGTLCPECDRAHMAEVWFVCRTCKRSMFPPVRALVLSDPDVTAFYHEHGIKHAFASWQTVVRSFEVREELRSEDPLRMRFDVPAGDDTLRLTLDDELTVVNVSR